MSPTIHLISGTPEDELREALAKGPYGGEVFGFYDPLHIGPLADIDGDGKQRAAFWEQIEPSTPAHEEYRDQERQLWARLAAEKLDVVVWRGASADEFLIALRVASRLRGLPSTLFEVVNTRRRPHLPEFYSAIAFQLPDHLATLSAERRRVMDLDARAAQWEAVRDRPDVCFRELDGERLVELPEDGCDGWLLSACASDWTNTAHVIVEVLSDYHFGDQVLGWRVKSLLARGLIEGRGQGNFGPAEIRATPATSSRAP